MSDVEVIDEEFHLLDHAENVDTEVMPEDLEKSVKQLENEIKDVGRQIRMLEGKKRFLERKKTEMIEKLQDEQTKKIKEQNWERKDFEWSDRLDAALVGIFGLTKYRADQLAVINASMSGLDVILIMPTGGGKSLTYQLPALVSPGLTLVVTPLISLMEDQIFALQKLGVNCGMLNSSTDKDEKNRVFKEMAKSDSDMKLLYVTPEKCAKSKQFMTKLQKMYQAGKLSRIAIDEVHCCSQWGHDFRTDYKFLGAMKGMFPEVPVLGLTATSTADVTKDVKSILRIPSSLVFLSGFNRPNLHYSVRSKSENAQETYDKLASLAGGEFCGKSGIIYTTTIKEVETVTEELRKRGIATGSYHAQLSPSHRRRVHQDWLANKIQVVVATLAFGMGIDKANVRFVIHNALPKSMENFYQESGRAGRDGKPAQCILFFRMSDVFKQSTMVFTEQTGLDKLYSMVTYCLNGSTCRRNLLAEHFLETWEPVPCEGMCDVCERVTLAQDMDISDYHEAAIKILNSAANKELRVTGLKLVEAMMGRGANNLKIDGWKSSSNRDTMEIIISHLIIEGYIKEDFHFTPYSTISYLVPGRRQLTSKLKIKIPKFEAKASKNKDSSLKVTQKPAKCHLDVKRNSNSKSSKDQPSNGHSPKKNSLQEQPSNRNSPKMHSSNEQSSKKESSKEQSSKKHSLKVQSPKKQPSKEQPVKCINKEEGEDSDEDFLPPANKKLKVAKSIIIDSDSE